MSRLLLILAAFAGVFGSTLAAEEPFAIDLTASVGKASKTVRAESAAPLAKHQDRETLDAKAGDRITVKWKLVNTDPKTTIKDVTVHFYAARAENASQVSIKNLGNSALAESALNMDFAPKETNEGELNFSIDKPGIYLLRLETIGAVAGPAGHEQFAALDVRVK